MQFIDRSSCLGLTVSYRLRTIATSELRRQGLSEANTRHPQSLGVREFGRVRSVRWTCQANATGNTTADGQHAEAPNLVAGRIGM